MPALDSSKHTFIPTRHMVRRERSLGQRWMLLLKSVNTHHVHFEEYIAAINSQIPIKAERNTSKTIWKEKGKAHSDDSFSTSP